jgi:ubiquitin related modifier 1
MRGAGVRPGVLVLVDDCDCELTGGGRTALADGQRVAFISTLHGG